MQLEKVRRWQDVVAQLKCLLLHDPRRSSILDPRPSTLGSRRQTSASCRQGESNLVLIHRE